MTNKHCSEEELQLYATGQAISDLRSIEHIKNCASCKHQIEVYQLIISGIQEQPAPSFDFDLEAAVMQKLQPVKKRVSSNSFYAVMIVIMIAVFTIASLYIFRNNFLILSAGVSSSFLVLSLIACAGIIGFKVVKLYKVYNLQIKKMNFSE